MSDFFEHERRHHVAQKEIAQMHLEFLSVQVPVAERLKLEITSPALRKHLELHTEALQGEIDKYRNRVAAADYGLGLADAASAPN